MNLDTSFETLKEMHHRLEKAHEAPDLRIGWIHDVEPHAEYGMPGIAVRTSSLDEHGDVSAVILWVPIVYAEELLRIIGKLKSKGFRRDMKRLEEEERSNCRPDR